MIKEHIQNISKEIEEFKKTQLNIFVGL